eukprot:CAMPEP_0114529948 /NCGR_PEP_ID=MMETSP0109-20121206/25146_1 /TAXON_ID=29199 /ORGANISM="Chlorarachnion reptans, Strain CCCM449" /LENGTH=202 /DNA_ID=CAMNT_0001712463 /DNA_START=526 /DNA_END=1131 /DNA_ORIENTATION=-
MRLFVPPLSSLRAITTTLDMKREKKHGTLNSSNIGSKGRIGSATHKSIHLNNSGELTNIKNHQENKSQNIECGLSRNISTDSRRMQNNAAAQALGCRLLIMTIVIAILSVGGIFAGLFSGFQSARRCGSKISDDPLDGKAAEDKTPPGRDSYGVLVACTFLFYCLILWYGGGPWSSTSLKPKGLENTSSFQSEDDIDSMHVR